MTERPPEPGTPPVENDDPAQAPDADETAPAEPGEPGEPGESVEDPDGPRRQARRERAARREAATRARAIEDARREAKQRAKVAALPRKPDGRGVVRGLKVMIWSLVITILAVGLGLLLYFTPIMSMRTLDIDGLDVVPREEVVAAVQVAPDTPLLQIDTSAVADRVASIRRVSSVRVQREYPSTLRVTISERVALAVKDFPDGPHLFDRDGVDFATEPPPPSLPYLDVEHPGPNDPPTRAALEVLTALQPDIAAQVARVAAPSVASVTLTLTDGRTVVWGTTDRTDEKAQKLIALLTRPGRTIDLSSPDLPTVK